MVVPVVVGQEILHHQVVQAILVHTHQLKVLLAVALTLLLQTMAQVVAVVLRRLEHQEPVPVAVLVVQELTPITQLTFQRGLLQQVLVVQPRLPVVAVGQLLAAHQQLVLVALVVAVPVEIYLLMVKVFPV
jgi:hypothetical protein